MNLSQLVCVQLTSWSDKRSQQLLADKLGVELITRQLPSCPLVLRFEPHGLVLSASDKTLGNPLVVDFAAGTQAHRLRFGGGRGQDIAKAVGLNKTGHVELLDATAGLGRDAFVLAGLGCSVQMIERHPVVFELLKDGLERASLVTDIDPVINRMTLIHADSTSVGRQQVQVIYLDPMFPESDKSAKVKKEMRYLHQLVGQDQDADLLLPWAQSIASHRVVVKRPRQAPYLNGQKPSLTFTGKSGRFDVYIHRAF